MKWSARGRFWETCVQEHFLFVLRTALVSIQWRTDTTMGGSEGRGGGCKGGKGAPPSVVHDPLDEVKHAYLSCSQMSVAPKMLS